ncbi:MAG: hypothetical protein PT934_06200 [Peptoniphilaceae bacterium]|uniref:hypothetical protein n=1 Tax=Parvimonas sp. TaxID=1944660 RepID=UPI0025DA075A|nr:hypothetical protein [Parvimonas sp.]MCI5997651.1 hypothetical protein [Parvimonas sp.]MDD7765343.1 hypothetical protein [Peptoniphilaceae bacterium]MDY3051262.1 hypothetical protein [Parvimonas sp.]
MKEKIYICLYAVLAFVMMLFPIFNLFTFIPLVIIYKKSNFKTYMLISVILTGLLFVVALSFSSFIPLIVSLIIIKGIEKNINSTNIVLILAFVVMMLFTADFLVVKMNAQIYSNLVNTLKITLKDIYAYNETLNLDDFESFMTQMANFYPAITFFMGYVSCSLGYYFLNRNFFYKKVDIKDVVKPVSYKFVAIFIGVGFLIGYLSKSVDINVYYRIYLIYANLFIAIFTFLFTQGFIAFNLMMKSRFTKIVSNILSIVSLFLVLSYLMYFVYGLYLSVVRSIKNEEKFS